VLLKKNHETHDAYFSDFFYSKTHKMRIF